MPKVLRSLRARVLLLIAIPLALVLGLTVYHAFGEREGRLLELALLVLTFAAVWLGSESVFVRRIAALTGAAEKLAKGDLATRVGFDADGDEIEQLALSFDRMAEALQSKELQLSRTVRALRVLSAGNRALAIAKRGEPELLSEMCRAIAEAGGHRLVWIGYVEGDAEKSLRPVAQRGSLSGKFLDSAKFTWGDAECGQTPLGKAIRNDVAVVVQDLQREPGPPSWRDYAMRSGCGSCVILPLRMDERVIGVLNICAEDTGAFGSEEVRLLSEAAADLSFGIASQRTRVERDRIARAREQFQEKLRKSLEASIRAIADTVEARDPHTAGHQRRVGELAVAIARELGVDEDEIDGIRLAANIHDLGRIQIPAEILTKPGRLTDSEFALVKTHSHAGYDILREIEFPWPIASIVLQHHERLDGSGYPQGLKGDEILQGSRIMAVADVVEAMTSHRPYHPGLAIEVALQEIESKRGTAFDPAAVDACLKLFRENSYAIPE
ncbi:MAG: GAF domain-containing protein [Burkholderiales bacterium]|nr:GAF domain-containing protein [Burkholderiales bacterium]